MPPKFKRYPNGERGGTSQERVNLLDYHDDDDDDEFILSENRGRQDDKVAGVQKQVDEVVEVMQDNIGKVINRGDKLEDLQEKSDDLMLNASQFRVSSKTLHGKMWWANCRMRILLAVVIAVILLVIFIPIIVKNVNKK